MVLPFARIAEPQQPSNASTARINTWSIALYLVGYGFFGAGYIAYMTFMIAYVRDAGGGAIAQTAFWTLIGLGAFAQPWVWSSLMAKARSGRVTALLIGLTALGAVIPLLGRSAIAFAASAVVFGNAFFAVVSSSTAFARLNFHPGAWPRAVALMTIAFGVGQIVGPIVIGAISDATGDLSHALAMSAVVLLAGAALCLVHARRQRRKRRAATPETREAPLSSSHQTNRECCDDYFNPDHARNPR
jgi:predicted MFS family arabinose efflux permease